VKRSAAAHGFVLVRERSLPELASLARLWKHGATGAELLSLSNADENKVFGVTLRTPPADSSGVAHILEHSVLCGSRKYPLKEPFVELLKGSLRTFLNAFTYPDKTCYPVASANLTDFFHLVDVYLDAVFFPKLSEETFQQEGWHLEVSSPPRILSYKGIVYNEMKGAFSAPESVLGRHSLRALFPDTVYSRESGGDPEAIPSLSYREFCDFHRKYYHPSNARFFFWGDDPEAGRLERIGAVLAPFSALNPALVRASSIGLQSALSAPRTLTAQYAASPAEEKAAKGLVTVNWLGPDVMDVDLGLAFQMLEQMLLGMPASPLRRALIESGLGEDLAGQGLESELRQLVFDAGLKGVDVSRAAAVEECIFAVLEDLARSGPTPELVEAAVNSVEFSLRENNSGRFPVGLSLMLRALTTWLHGGDPLAPLAFEAPLAAVKTRLAAGEPYFETLIRRWFLDNTHRVTIILAPDAQLDARREAEEQARLAALAASMDKQALAETAARAEALARLQAAPDPPEALASIPRLRIADLPARNVPIPTEILSLDGAPLYFHGLTTGGILYAEAGFNLDGLPAALVPLVPLFGRALLEMGTEKRDFTGLSMAIARKTGGMDAAARFLTRTDTRAPVCRLILSGKAAPDKRDDLFSLLDEILRLADLDHQDRFLRMALEEKARLEHSLIPSGHAVVAARLRAACSPAADLAEQAEGIFALDFLRSLIPRLENDWPSVLDSLQALRSLLLTRARLELNITAPPEHRDALLAPAGALVRALPPGSLLPPAWTRLDLPPAEALILPARVNYVGKGLNLFDAGYVWHGSALVILNFLRTGYLWEKIRVQGGAYGCQCGLDRMSGAFFMVSYRDPGIQDTLDVFDAAAAHLRRHPPSPEELNASVVGAIGELDTYLLPDAKGSAAYCRALARDTDELRQTLREEILGAGPDHFRRFGQALEALAPEGRICALGGAALDSAARKAGWARTAVL
jgi:Zn-dependent M16 (insulinase) family peptidase